jgi:hypothetical protein
LDGTLEVKACSMENNQKWILNSGGFLQLYVDASKVVGSDSNGKIKVVDASSGQSTKFEAYQSKL